MLSEPSGANSVFRLPSVVGRPEWSALAAAVKRRLHDSVDGTATLDCAELTWLTPAVFLAMGELLDSAPKRVRLRNWPSALSKAMLPRLIATCVRDCLRATSEAIATVSSRPLDARHVTELERALDGLAACIAELGRAWSPEGRHTAPGLTAVRHTFSRN